jgi:hypothetical protein
MYARQSKPIAQCTFAAPLLSGYGFTDSLWKSCDHSVRLFYYKDRFNFLSYLTSCVGNGEVFSISVAIYCHTSNPEVDYHRKRTERLLNDDGKTWIIYSSKI